MIDNNITSSRGTVLFALGFRPFYLAAGVLAVLALPAWVGFYFGWIPQGAYLRGVAWHTHEMAFGFAPAVIAGFLLTAVRNWTGLPTPTGVPLGALVALWAAGRVLILTGPGPVAAIVDSLFLPVLAGIVGLQIIRSNNRRNLKIVAVLAGLAAANMVFHASYAGSWPAGLQRTAVVAALGVIALLIAIVGGRVIPAFTGNAIPDAKPRLLPAVERAAVGGLVLVLLMTVTAPWVSVPESLRVAILGVTGIANGVRLAFWAPLKTRANALLWMLPVAYAWLPLALLLRAAGVAGWVQPAVALHALTVGAMSSLMVAMMTRSALGHTGRGLRAGPVELIAFLGLQLAAVIRVLLPIANPDAQALSITASMILWSVAFGVFVAGYGPKLLRPRVDGRPG